MKSSATAAAAILGLLVSSADCLAAEKFQKLGGSQIRAKFVGMEMTDNVHWARVWSKRQPQELFDGPQEGWQMVDRKG
jgi:hypothetical protein